MVIQHPAYLGCFLDMIKKSSTVFLMDIDNLQSANAPSCALKSKTPLKTQLQSSLLCTGAVH